MEFPDALLQKSTFESIAAIAGALRVTRHRRHRQGRRDERRDRGRGAHTGGVRRHRGPDRSRGAGGARRQRRRRVPVPAGVDPGAARGAHAGRPGAGRARRRGHVAGRRLARRDRAGQALRVHRHGLRDAPDPGGLPGRATATPPSLRDFAAPRSPPEQLLLASATTEIGIGGDMRTQQLRGRGDGDRRSPDQAGAGDLLRRVRRRHPGHGPARRRTAPPSDQVLVVLPTRGDCTLEPVGTLGHPRLPRHLQPRLPPRRCGAAPSSPARRLRRHLRADDGARVARAVGRRCGSASPTAAAGSARALRARPGARAAPARRRPRRCAWPSSTVVLQAVPRAWSQGPPTTRCAATADDPRRTTHALRHRR